MNDNTQQAGILIVDDVRANISVFVQILRTDYKISVATSGEKALVAGAHARYSRSKQEMTRGMTNDY